MTVLTTAQALDRLIENDARNVRDCGKYGSTLETRWCLIADCAGRLFEARDQDKRSGGREMERKAEFNLRNALALVGKP